MSFLVQLGNVSCAAESVAAIAIKEIDSEYNVIVRYKNCPESDVCSLHSTVEDAEESASLYKLAVDKGLKRKQARDTLMVLAKKSALKQV